MWELSFLCSAMLSEAPRLLNNSWPSLPLKLQPQCALRAGRQLHSLTSCLLCGELQEEKKGIFLQATLAKAKGRQGQDGVS